MNIKYYIANIPFTTSFKHGSAERSETDAVIVEITNEGITGYGEGCPRSYVTGETIESCLAFYKENESDYLAISSLDSLKAFVSSNSNLIDSNPAAWCAVELALLDFLSKREGISVEQLIGLSDPRQHYQYSAIMGDNSPDKYSSLYQQYRSFGFSDFKIKLSEDIDLEKKKTVCFSQDINEISLRADANNLWSSPTEAIDYLKTLNLPIKSLEEPLASKDFGELEEIARALDVKIILDESLLNMGQVKGLEVNPSIWIANVRVSKMGGILRSLELIKKLARLGIDITIGAQVGETSLLTRAALILADAAEDMLVAQEGAFGNLLLERDIFEPMIQFGVDGILEAADIRSKPGFGLKPVAALESDVDLSCQHA